MANWCIKISEYYLEKVVNLISEQIKAENELLHSDETVIQCNKETGRQASSNSYMWVMCSGEEEQKKGIVFHYDKSRSAEVAKEILKGYNGILVTDGYASYNNLEGIAKHAECWTHCRRYFYESIPLTATKKLDTTADGYTGVTYCDKLFEIEREIAELGKEEKEKVRQEKSKPILDAFFCWVNKTTEKIVLNKKLTKALTYATNQKKELSVFIEDGRIPLSNSLAERAIRPFAVHRKNWLFADSIAGAKANAVIYSLIESAKLNNLNIYNYIKYLLEELPQLENANDKKEIEKYMPWSKELPKEVVNFQGEYEELDLSKE